MQKTTWKCGTKMFRFWSPELWAEAEEHIHPKGWQQRQGKESIVVNNRVHAARRLEANRVVREKEVLRFCKTLGISISISFFTSAPYILDISTHSSTSRVIAASLFFLLSRQSDHHLWRSASIVTPTQIHRSRRKSRCNLQQLSIFVFKINFKIEKSKVVENCFDWFYGR